MNNSDLDSILKKARPPQPPDEFWADLPQYVIRQANRKQMIGSFPRLGFFPRLAWGLAAVFCVLIAFAVGHWRGQVEKEAGLSKDILTNPKLVQETLATFPGQVRAIVEDQRGLNVVLCDTSNVPASPPIYVRICDGKNCGAAVTFSGQEIQVAGQKFTALSEADGGIILEGKDFIWTDKQRSSYGIRLKIEAKNISPAIL